MDLRDIGIGWDAELPFPKDMERALAREAAALGYRRMWNTAPPDDPDPFARCELWHSASRIATGVAVVPLTRWSTARLVARIMHLRKNTGGDFILGVGSGRERERPVRLVRERVLELRRQLPEVPIVIAALGPQMLRLAGQLADGVVINWSTFEHVLWSRSQVADAAVASGRRAGEVTVQQYVRVAVHHDASRARLALGRAFVRYALFTGSGDPERGYRAHFSRMGWQQLVDELARMNHSGASVEELVERTPDELLSSIGYWGPLDDAPTAIARLAHGLDRPVVRMIATETDVGFETARAVMRAAAAGLRLPRGGN